MTYILLLVYVIAGSLGMVLIKYGGSGVSFSAGKILSASVPLYFFAGISLYVISFFLWIYLLQCFKITYISPVAYGLVFVAVGIFSAIILNEQITAGQIVGAALIIAGVTVATVMK